MIPRLEFEFFFLVCFYGTRVDQEGKHKNYNSFVTFMRIVHDDVTLYRTSPLQGITEQVNP